MNSKKERIYLLPGLMCTEELWSKLTLHLQSQYEFVFVSIPLKKSVESMVEALYEVLPCDEAVNILGFSLGGYLASAFAVKYPQKVKRLFVLAASACSMSEAEILKRKEVLAMIETFGFKGLSRKKVLTLLDEAHQKDEALIEIIQRMYTELGKEVFQTQIEGTLYRKNLMKELLELTMPICFYYAQNDRLVDTSWLQNLAKKKPAWINEEKNSCSHMLPLEHPLKLSEVIKKWLHTAL